MDHRSRKVKRMRITKRRRDHRHRYAGHPAAAAPDHEARLGAAASPETRSALGELMASVAMEFLDGGSVSGLGPIPERASRMTATEDTNEKASVATYAYDEWMAAQRLPVHRGYFIDDVRTLEVDYWAQRATQSAFIQLEGQQGVSEARISEIPAGESLPPYRVAIDEIVFVASGHGMTAVSNTSGDKPVTFEWGPQALFLVPRHTLRSFANMRGDQPVRLLHYSYLPLAMSVIPDPPFLLGGAPAGAEVLPELGSAFSEAKAVAGGSGLKWIGSGKSAYWYGNFFPDMGIWDKLDRNLSRGAGGSTVNIQFAGSDMSCHMSEFASRTYKKAHRHGPGRVIIIVKGEGYSVMWPEGEEKVIVPWHEGSIVVPPDRWFHQHFNLGSEPARYLAFHPPLQFHGYADKAQDRQRDQIEYVDEEAWIRERFESQLAERGISSLMPAEAFHDRDYRWDRKASS